MERFSLYINPESETHYILHNENFCILRSLSLPCVFIRLNFEYLRTFGFWGRGTAEEIIYGEAGPACSNHNLGLFLYFVKFGFYSVTDENFQYVKCSLNDTPPHNGPFW